MTPLHLYTYILKSKIILIFIFFLPSACSSQAVDTGAEVLLNEHLDELKGQRVGLIMNPTARVEGTHMLDTLLARGVNITALFAPEHGFRGDFGAGEVIKNGIDQATGLSVYSLYGDTRKPTPQMLQEVDLLLFDIQGVGARFYTYITTLGLILEAAAAAGVPVWVLDRPNPAGGNYISGWMMHKEHQSFVGAYPIPMVYGMTMGELAIMMIGEQWIDFEQPPELRVIKMKGWQRPMQWPETGLKWIPPSPNLPTFEHAFVYLGTVLFEGTNISEGRGTSDPFLTIGSPKTDISEKQLQNMRKSFPAISIKRTIFTPKSIPDAAPNPDYEGQTCYGIKLSVKNYEKFNPVTFGAALLRVMLNATEGARTTDYIELLTGIDEEKLLEQLQDKSYQKVWHQTAETFREKREPYLLYE